MGDPAATAAPELGWHVSASVDGSGVVAEGRAAIDAGADGCVTVDVDGLEPATTYHFWFDLDGVLSPMGRTPTLPEGPTDRVRIAMVCCADPSRRPLTAYRAVAEDEVDLVLHVGDYIYETAGDEHRVEPDRDCLDVTDYRLRHAFLREDPDLQALHLRHPMIFVWDDHDIADNAWRRRGQGPRPRRARPLGGTAARRRDRRARSGCRRASRTPTTSGHVALVRPRRPRRAGRARHPHPGP